MSLNKRQIILDCDPGQDDAISLLFAMASPQELEILGITTVAGNVPLELTQRNARQMCDIAQRGDIKVYAGCASPMSRALVTAEHVHGNTGINGIEIVEPTHPLEELHAVDFLVQTLQSAPEDAITLVPTGPLTNIARAFEADPGIISKVAEIVLMGGAMREGGNYTPSAEFNIFVDPEAAQIVFNCGRPIVALGLDVTHQALATQERREAIRSIANAAGRATAGMLDFFSRHDSKKYGWQGAPLHDPCTVAYLLDESLFEGKFCNISIETQSTLTLGHTAVDFWAVTDRPKNARWIHSIDAERFYALLIDRLSRFDAS